MSLGDKMLMACVSCGSENQTLFGAEMNIHFPGLEGLDKPGVLAFPHVKVCFSCGLALFVLPPRELCQLDKDRGGENFRAA